MTLRHRFRSVRGAFVKAGAVGAAVVVLGGLVVAPATAQPTAPKAPDVNLIPGACPALFAFGVQGTGESSPDAAPTTDTGMLSTVFAPMLAKSNTPGLVDRAYVPYESGFGGAVPGGQVPYSQSVEGGLAKLRSMVQGVAANCEKTQFAVAAYSQGAHVGSMFAQEVGQGRGVIPAERLAAVALFGDPTRNPSAPLFPGAPGKQTPDPAPGTEGAAVSAIKALAQLPATGGGIAPERDVAPNFGAVTGRVATFCVAGDLACDAPTGAPILRAVTNVVGQSKLSGGDPVASLASIAQALAFTTIKTATKVVNEDISGNSLANLSINPRKSISERLAEASDPRAPVNIPDALKALLKVGMIGLNVVTTVVRTVLTPANIADLATVGLANPPAALLALGTKLLGALPQLIPPTTVSRLVQQSFTAVVDNITDNAELLNTATWVKYWDTVQRHGAYGSATVAANGEAPVQFVADWFAALARDVAAAFGAGGDPLRKPVAGSATPVPGRAPAGDYPFGPGAGSASSTAPKPQGDFPFGP